MSHPLDRPVWSSLSGRQEAFAITRGGARRLAPDYGLFAAVADQSAPNLADLASLVRAHGTVGLVEAEEPPPIPGAVIISSALCWQMVAQAETAGPAPDFAILPLGEADAPEMLELATLTKPGPFFGRTHQLGEFIGVRVDGRLAAMAGERMKVAGFTEVSGVCTHPDYRGNGYAAVLMRQVMTGIRARGETPFLHAYASNAGGIALHQSVGFAFRRELVMTTLAEA